MDFNFSIFKEIDFANPENLIFLVIFFIVLIIFVLLVLEIIRLIKKLLNKIFGIEVRRPGFNKNNTDWLHSRQAGQEMKEVDNMPKRNAMAAEFKDSGISEKNSEPDKTAEQKYDEKEQKDIVEGLDKLKGINLSNSEESRGAIQKVSLGSTIKIPVSKNKVVDEPDKTAEQKYDEKEQKDIVEGLDKLKGINPSNSEESRGAIQKVSLGSTIKIPTSEHFTSDEKMLGKDSSAQDIPLMQHADALKNDHGIHSKAKSEDKSIFKGKSEISREELQHEMRADPIVWKAMEQEGLNFSSIEREKLAKKVFSSNLGRNISKADLKLSVKKLNQKLQSEKSSVEHAKIRKEIKFFKKIGGIK